MNKLGPSDGHNYVKLTVKQTYDIQFYICLSKGYCLTQQLRCQANAGWTPTHQRLKFQGWLPCGKHMCNMYKHTIVICHHKEAIICSCSNISILTTHIARNSTYTDQGQDNIPGNSINLCCYQLLVTTNYLFCHTLYTNHSLLGVALLPTCTYYPQIFPTRFLPKKL